jgi:SpoIVB peptidase S55
MRKKTTIEILLLSLIICMVLSAVEGSVPILPLDQVKAGMKGKGRSVFQGNRIEEFDVEIIGVLKNVEPKKSIILARLKGGILEEAGVISGMSGSPVYVDGKLIGAVAYSLGTFVKEPIAGITPIGEMMAISEKRKKGPVFSPQVPVKKHLTLDELFMLNKDFFLSKAVFHSEGRALKPLSIPLVFSGFSSYAFEQSRSFFSNLGFNPVMSAFSGQSLETISPPDLTLREGGPVAIQLVSGDLDMSAVGTVTYIDGSKVLAFGHPLYNLGAVDYAMTKAKVITVVPSLISSFKLAVSDSLVGKFTQDRSSGLLGELGKIPRLIPVNIRIMDSDGELKEYKIKVVNDKILTPVLLNVAIGGIVTTEERAIGDLSLGLLGNIYLENGMNIRLEDLFSGQFDNSVVSLSSLLAGVVYFLTNNEFEELGIHRIDLNIQAFEEVKFSFLEKVWLSKYEASPGERIDVKIDYRTFRGESQREEGSIQVPNLPPGSEFQIIVADAASMAKIEMSQYRTATFVPRNLSQLVRMLSNLRKNNRIYIKIIASKPGIFLRGEEMSNLPPSMRSMFASPRAAASSPTELTRSTLMEYQLPIPYVFRGEAVIPVKIKK